VGIFGTVASSVVPVIFGTVICLVGFLVFLVQ